MTQHLISTTASPSRCPRCGKPTLAALDEGIPARVDATALSSRQAEIAALINGLATYVLTRSAHLIYRSAERISANTIRGDIHAEHQCAGPTQLTLDDLMGQK